MKDTVRLQLIEMITRYGPNIIEDPRRVEGLLLDLCGDRKREIHGLLDALHERVPLDLCAASGGTPAILLVTSLTRRLVDNRPMAEDMASWAVESWAIALGVLPPDWAPVRKAVYQPPPVQIEPPQPAPAPPWREFAPQMVRIPAGQFWMGAVQDAWDFEKPYHQIHLDEYWIGKTPVTVAEFRDFVQQVGYRTTAEHKKSESTWRAPKGKGSNLAGKEYHPVTCVSWEDAQAYCQWLSQSKGQHYSLPSEAQWEKAARGVDGRIYPWGNTEPDKSQCNVAPWFGDTTPVGKFSPAGDSPYGCADMAGNVWEWCSDWWSEDYYLVSPSHNPGGPDSGQSHIYRGGSWADNRWHARCARRGKPAPGHFGYNFGFRLVLSVEPVKRASESPS